MHPRKYGSLGRHSNQGPIGALASDEGNGKGDCMADESCSPWLGANRTQLLRGSGTRD